MYYFACSSFQALTKRSFVTSCEGKSVHTVAYAWYVPYMKGAHSKVNYNAIAVALIIAEHIKSLLFNSVLGMNV